jgi:hypothetical protein
MKRLAEGGGQVNANTKNQAKNFIFERGFTIDNFIMPAGFEARIIRIRDVIAEVPQNYGALEISPERLEVFKERLNKDFNARTTVEERLNLDEVIVDVKNEILEAICPTCKRSIKVWEKGRKVFKPSNFVSHLKLVHHFNSDDEEDPVEEE